MLTAGQNGERTILTEVSVVDGQEVRRVVESKVTKEPVSQILAAVSYTHLDVYKRQVSYLYQPYNPSILRLINNVIKAAHAEGKWAGMCGEMAGDQTAVPLLVGMGLDEFSMSATSVLRTRSLMKKLDTAKMQEYANRALTECSTMEEVLELSKEYVNVD